MAESSAEVQDSQAVEETQPSCTNVAGSALKTALVHSAQLLTAREHGQLAFLNHSVRDILAPWRLQKLAAIYRAIIHLLSVSFNMQNRLSFMIMRTGKC